jgi:nuclear receptor interaction protein
MLEETRDTITVPAAFMIRMLTCLNNIRRDNTTTDPSATSAPDAAPAAGSSQSSPENSPSGDG